MKIDRVRSQIVRLPADEPLADSKPFPGATRDIVVIKDKMDRKTYDRPDRIGVGPLDRGIAFSVALADIEAIVE